MPQATLEAFPRVGRIEIAPIPGKILPETGEGLFNIGGSINKFFNSIFEGITSLGGPKPTRAPVSQTKPAGIPRVSTSTKVLATTATATTGLGILALTRGGQNLVNQSAGVATDFAKLGSDATKFFANNPLVALGLVVIGGVLVISFVGGRKR